MDNLDLTPTMIGWLGVVASVLAIIGTLIKLAEPGSEILFKIGFLLMILFEITLGGWLLIYSREIP